MKRYRAPKVIDSQPLNDLLSASSVIMWLDDEIDRLVYPVGSLDIPRSDRERIARKLAKARKHIRVLQDVGR